MNGVPVDIISIPSVFSDAFGRLRVSQPLTLFESFNRFQEDTHMTRYQYGTASIRHEANASSVVLTVGTDAGDALYRESSLVFAYQPGKSLLILQSFAMNAPKTGLRQRIGYFDVQNGIYLQTNGTAVSFVRRSYVSGAVLETVVDQKDWNVDPMDGIGPSRHLLHVERAQILFIDVEWLGVGSVRMGFVLDGKFYLCHVFHHANKESTAFSDSTKPYMTTACLPVRSELENTSTTDQQSSLRIICTTVISEGGYDIHGREFSIGYSTIDAPKTLPEKNTLYPVIALRLKSTRLNAIVIPTQISMVAPVAGDYRWALISNPTVTGGNSWVDAGNTSSVEYKLDGTNAITDGIIMKSGYFTATTLSSAATSLADSRFKFQLERDSFTGNAYPMVLAVACGAINGKILASIDFEEIP
jgi:hypothetical protein